jgi:outer membrane receptor protein involved in Fe transport
VGGGFHSNDARGSTITLDPATLEPADRVDPLVRAWGSELGMRSTRVPRTQATLALWRLDIDSELLFVGDAGNTEATRPSRRYGLEGTLYWRPRPWLTLDADVAYSLARFTDEDPAGDRIPGSVEGVVAAGVSLDELRGFSGALRLRSFGPRPLVEDGSVRSAGSTLLSARLGYRIARRWQLGLDVLNLTNARASDIDYYYPSRLPGEPAGGIEDVHTHPVEPRAVRLSLSTVF